MASGVECYIIDIVEDSASRLGGTLRPGTTRPIGTQAFKKDVADATRSFLVDGLSREHDCVLIVSNRRFPDFVGQAIRKAREAQSVLGSSLGRRVCDPLLDGTWNGQSYALYKRLDGFSDNRYLKRIQTLCSVDAIFEWLAGVFDMTKEEHGSASARERNFLDALRTLSSDESLEDAVRQAACALESRVSRGVARTFTCLQHGDFWTGNVLFCRSTVSALSPVRNEFQVIDWAGSRPDGFPGIDALRFSLSAFGQGRLASRWLGSYCAATGLTKPEFALHCVCAMGQLGTNLDQFPKQRFDALTASLLGFLERHDFLDLR